LIDVNKRVPPVDGRHVVIGEATILHYRACDGTPESVRLLLEHGADVNARDGIGQTPLIIAAECKRTEIVEVFLTDAPSVDVNAATFYGRTALHGAARSGDIDMVRLLLDSGAKQQAFTSSVYAAWVFPMTAAGTVSRYPTLLLGATYASTPISLAADEIAPFEPRSAQFREIVKLLRLHGGQTDLFTAIALGDVESIKAAIESDPNVVHRRHKRGYPPLQIAVEQGEMSVVRMLLDSGCRVDSRNAHGRGGTALHVTAFLERPAMARLLIERGADVDAADNYANTPLHHAARTGAWKVAATLINAGANVNGLDKNGKTPLDFARTDEVGELLRGHGGQESDRLPKE
jgi:cytohesin